MYVATDGLNGCCDVALNLRDGGRGLIDHHDDVSPSSSSSSSSLVLQSYGRLNNHCEGAGLVDCCAAVASDHCDGGAGLMDRRDAVSSSSSMLSYGGLNDLCDDATERGDGAPGLIDPCDNISPPSSSTSWSLSSPASSTALPSYSGLNNLCGVDIVKWTQQSLWRFNGSCRWWTRTL